jgi:L-ascorbate metabolism protein UlaG (beta-lactamase superfamily)
LGRIPFRGSIPRDVRPPLRLNRFRIEGTYGILIEIDDRLSIFHLGSADILPQTIEGVRCDILLLCVVGRGRHRGLTDKLLTTLRPRVVIPCHFDDFLTPMEGPLRVLRRVDLEGFGREVHRCGVGSQVVLLDRLASFRTEL